MSGLHLVVVVVVVDRMFINKDFGTAHGIERISSGTSLVLSRHTFAVVVTAVSLVVAVAVVVLTHGTDDSTHTTYTGTRY